MKHESVECQDSVISYPVLIATSRSSSPQFEVRVDEVNYEQKKNLYPPSSDSVTATVAHVLVDSPPSSPESVHQAIVVNRFAGKSKEEAAAILIQSTFRGHLVCCGLIRTCLLSQSCIIPLVEFFLSLRYNVREQGFFFKCNVLLLWFLQCRQEENRR